MHFADSAPKDLGTGVDQCELSSPCAVDHYFSDVTASILGAGFADAFRNLLLDSEFPSPAAQQDELSEDELSELDELYLQGARCEQLEHCEHGRLPLAFRDAPQLSPHEADELRARVVKKLAERGLVFETGTTADIFIEDAKLRNIDVSTDCGFDLQVKAFVSLDFLFYINHGSSLSSTPRSASAEPCSAPWA